MQASGFLLGQSRPNGTSALSLYDASLITEVTKIIVANVTGTDTTFSLYHDDDGSTYDENSALFFSVPIEGNTTVMLTADTLNGGITLSPGGSLGHQSGTANALTFSAYGTTQQTSKG